MDIRDSQRIKEILDNTAKMADAFTRIADALERLADRKTENCSEKPNNSKERSELCRECDDYAGDGMYCASNYLVRDFSTSAENCEMERNK